MLLDKINRLKNWQVALIILIFGFAVYSGGLSNHFLGDDLSQIVDSVPVHSITNIRLFFDGGTFYNGQGNTPLSGSYYRPLMTTVFSLIYTVFGAQPFFFHLVQLLICTASAFILYLIFRYSFKLPVALFLALIFFLDPIDSQVVLAIPSMQDALFFFFGILALWLLIRFKSVKSIIFAVICLMLSLLAKETAVLFIFISLLYLFWFDARKRAYSIAGMLALPCVLYLILRIHAIGILPQTNIAPIDGLGIVGRLLTAPSVLSLFVSKFILPFNLASSYYWTYPSFSVQHVLLPLVIDLTAISILIYGALLLLNKSPKPRYFTYLFYALWSTSGFLLILQIIPLDMTASETWFYFPMVGILGMAGVLIENHRLSLTRRQAMAAASLIIVTLGALTFLKDFDWKNQYTVSNNDVSVSKGNYVAESNIAEYYIQHNNLNKAKVFAEESVNTFPTAINNNTLGQVLYVSGDFPGAYKAFTNGLKYQNYINLYDNLATLTAGYGNYSNNRAFLLRGIKLFPNDETLWFYLAILEYRNGDKSDAKLDITQAYQNSHSTYAVEAIYERIINNAPLNVVFKPTATIQTQ